MVAPDSPYQRHQPCWPSAGEPWQLFYGSPGIGTPDHINTASYLRQNGVTGTHVPFSGGGAVANAILSGRKDPP